MNHTMRLPIILSAMVALSAVASAKEPAKSNANIETITLAKMISDLEQKGELLSKENFVTRSKGADTKKPLFDKDKAEAFQAISQHLIKRRNTLSNQSEPTDPYYAALQRQLHAQCHLESLDVWWNYCRKGTEYESMAAIQEVPLWNKLTQDKAAADQLVADNQPVAEESQNNETKHVDPLITERIQGKNSILDKIDGWKELPEESKSKIISR